MKLTEFKGKHVLDAVDFETSDTTEYGEPAEIDYIRLDGKVYKITEDPDDGYRSMLDDIERVDREMKNVFPPQEVIGVLESDEELIQLINPDTGQTVLTFGTADADDYYPCFVFDFDPKEMDVNKCHS